MPFSYEIAGVRNAPPTAMVGAPFQITLIVDGPDARNGDQYQIRFPPGAIAFPTPLATVAGVNAANPEARLVFDAPTGFQNVGNVGLAFHRVPNPSAVLTVAVAVAAPQPLPLVQPQVQPPAAQPATMIPVQLVLAAAPAAQPATVPPQGQTPQRHWSFEMFMNMGASVGLIAFALFSYLLLTFIGSLPSRGLNSSFSRTPENSAGTIINAADDVNVYYGDKERPEGK